MGARKALQFGVECLAERQIRCVAEEHPDGVGDQCFAPTRRRRYPRCLVHRHAQVIIPGANRIADVQTDPRPDSCFTRAGLKYLLDLVSCLDSRSRRVESSHGTIAEGLDDCAPMTADDLVEFRPREFAKALLG